MYHNDYLKTFFKKVEQISPRDTDTEEDVLDNENFDVRNPE